MKITVSLRGSSYLSWSLGRMDMKLNIQSTSVMNSSGNFFFCRFV